MSQERGAKVLETPCSYPHLVGRQHRGLGSIVFVSGTCTCCSVYDVTGFLLLSPIGVHGLGLRGCSSTTRSMNAGTHTKPLFYPLGYTYLEGGLPAMVQSR